MLQPTIKFFAVLLLSVVFASCASETAIQVQEAPDAQEQTIEEPAQSEPVVSEEPAEFVVTDEIFDQTFQAVEVVIAELNALIRAGEYQRWLSYLTDDYIETFSDPEFLANASQADRLKNNGIVLSSLEDYFTHVVVPSRANLRLDDLVFIDENQVEAIMIIRDQRITVYNLRLIDNQWKIQG